MNNSCHSEVMKSILPENNCMPVDRKGKSPFGMISSKVSNYYRSEERNRYIHLSSYKSFENYQTVRNKANYLKVHCKSINSTLNSKSKDMNYFTNTSENLNMNSIPKKSITPYLFVNSISSKTNKSSSPVFELSDARKDKQKIVLKFPEACEIAHNKPKNETTQISCSALESDLNNKSMDLVHPNNADINLNNNSVERSKRNQAKVQLKSKIRSINQYIK